MNTQEGFAVQSSDQKRVEAANKLLDYLVTYAKPVEHWGTSLKDEGFKGSEVKTAVARINHTLARRGRDKAIGIWIGGTGAAHQAAGLDNGLGRWAVQLLKENDRIVQLGKGRGRALAVIDPTHLEEPKPIKITETSSDKDTINALRDEIAELRAKLEAKATI